MATASNSPSPGERIRTAKVRTFITLCKVMPIGSLQAFKQTSGAVSLFWRYTHEDRSERVPIGIYDASLPPKSLEPKGKAFSIHAAVRHAEELAKRHLAHLEAGGHKAIIAAERIQRANDRMEKDERAKATLRALLESYTRQLKDLKRQAHRDVASMFALHVFEPFPHLSDAPAGKVTDEQIADVLRRLFEEGKHRTAAKLRSYMRAAYELARRARVDPSVPVHFKAFNIRANPAADTAPGSGAHAADKQPLSLEQLRQYWQALQSVEGMRGAALRLHLLTGGQRIAQFSRLETARTSRSMITLLDGKGRPGKPPRLHQIPLIPDAAKEVERLSPSGPWAISTDAGETHVAPTTLSGWASEVAETVPIHGFKAKRIRSGIETLLAARGVDKDHRGRLQSHGISGVQATHYDGHDYLPQKHQCLVILHQALVAQQRPVQAARHRQGPRKALGTPLNPVADPPLPALS